MRQTLSFILAAFSVAGALNRSPNGVPVITTFPIIDLPTTPAIPACQNKQLPPPKLIEPTLRAKAGLEALSQLYQVMYLQAQDGAENPRPEWEQMWLDELYEKITGEPPTEPVTNPRSKRPSDECAIQEVLATHTTDVTPLQKAYCDCLDTQRLGEVCFDVAVAQMETLCYSDYEPFNGYCDAMKAESDPTFNVHIPSTCAGPRAGELTDTKMEMDNMLYFNMVPDVLPEAQIEAEGRTYYLAWKALQRFTAFSEASIRCDHFVGDVDIIPDWTAEQYIYSSQPGEGTKSFPIAMIAKYGAEQFMVVVRDAITSLEGRLSAFVKPAFHHMPSYPGRVHEGYAAMAQAINPSLDLYFHDFFEETWNSSRTSLSVPRMIVVANGQFGSGVGALIAHHLATTFGTPKYGDYPRVDAIMFSGSHVGDAEFSESYRSLVNGRHIFSTHGYNFLHCPTAPECANPSHYSEASPPMPVAYGERENRNHWSPLGGGVEVDSINDDFFKQKHGTDEIIDQSLTAAGTTLDFVTQSVCVPACYLSQRFCKDDTSHMCDRQSCSTLKYFDDGA